MGVRRIVFSRGVTIALALVAVVILGGYGLVAYRAIPPQPNIFAEIYADTEKNYERNPDILEIPAVFQQKDDDVTIGGDSGPTYYFRKSKGEIIQFENILGNFYFDNNEGFSLSFIKKEGGLNILEVINYSKQNHTLIRNAYIKISGSKYIDDVNYAVKLLQDAGITREDLESYYRTVVEDYILADWVKVYNSNFSPTDYGEITIVDEWDQYFE